MKQEVIYELDEQGRQFSRDWVTSRSRLWRRIFLDAGVEPGTDLQGIPADFEPILDGVSAVRGIEIGVLEGRSACWFAEHLLGHPESRLIAIDPSSDHHARLVAQNLGQTPNGRRVEFIRQCSNDAFTTVAAQRLAATLD